MHNPGHRVQTTKKLLRDALLSLLREKPLRSITVKELCARAKLNRGTFYAHYADVYDLMTQIETEMRADFFAALEPMICAEWKLTPAEMTKRVFECIEANADLCRVIAGPYGDKEFARSLLHECRENCVQSCLRYFPNAEHRHIETYFTFVTGGCYALMDRWIRDDMSESTVDLAAFAEKIMESGVGFLKETK